MNNINNLTFITDQFNSRLAQIQHQHQPDISTSNNASLHEHPNIHSTHRDSRPVPASSSLQSLSSILPTNFAATQLATLPVLLPFELDQLLDDNDALIEVINGLYKRNKVYDALPYIDQLHDNLSVLMYHQEIYTRSCQQNGLQLCEQSSDMPLQGGNNEEDANSETLTSHNTHIAYPCEESIRIIDHLTPIDGSVPDTDATNNRVVDVSIALFHYIEAQITRAQALTTLGVSHGLSAQKTKQLYEERAHLQTKWAALQMSQSKQAQRHSRTFQSRPIIRPRAETPSNSTSTQISRQNLAKNTTTTVNQAVTTTYDDHDIYDESDSQF